MEKRRVISPLFHNILLPVGKAYNIATHFNVWLWGGGGGGGGGGERGRGVGQV